MINAIERCEQLQGELGACQIDLREEREDNARLRAELEALERELEETIAAHAVRVSEVKRTLHLLLGTIVVLAGDDVRVMQQAQELVKTQVARLEGL